jgi:hypothetical protein
MIVHARTPMDNFLKWAWERISAEFGEKDKSPAPSQSKRPKQTQDQIRGDLIRRLFAVAISVGAASTLSRMHWVTNGCWPDLREWQQLSILVAATVATVLSWDGYLMSIEDRPLMGFWRFAVDVALVFIYMFLLMTSQHRTWWLFIHALTFVLYVIWDYLTVREHTDKYYPSNAIPEPNKRSVCEIYIAGLEDRDRPSRSPIITLGWALYFCLLYLINKRGLDDRVFGATIFALAGLILYRQDKKYRWTLRARSLVTVGLLIASGIYICFGPGDRTIWTVAGPYIGPTYCVPENTQSPS